MMPSNPTPLFQFMTVRSPQTVADKTIKQFYIKDEVVVSGARNARDVFSKESTSAIGQLLFNRIICEASSSDISTRNLALVYDVLELLDHTTISCDPTTGITNASMLNEFEQRPFIYHNDKYYFLTTQIGHTSSEFDKHKLIKTRKLIEKYIEHYDRKALLADLRALYDVEILTEVIYNDDGGYNFSYQQIRDILFDNLYILYILRRITSINLEDIIAGLQTLHTLEMLAIEDLLDAIQDGRADVADAHTLEFINFLYITYPDLNEVDLNDASRLYVAINDQQMLLRYFQSTPIIHPLPARLHWYNKPFNKIRPIGIGDLKVVKETLLGYTLGEISHIHNIMKGETKERTHRHAEKSEESFSFVNENNSDSQTENQTTDRFEVKKEAESVIKTDINVGANANLTYKNEAIGITTTVGANFAYNNSRQDTQKTASNYARDVMDKAVTNIQNRSSQSRTVTKIFETEEINKHSITNTLQGATHVSGIYRWLDKKYKAQLYNYGKRLMFEFIIPEPAAFYVLSKLKAVEFDIDAPTKPPLPEYEIVKVIEPGTQDVELLPASILKPMFDKLRLKYDLAEFNYPPADMTIHFSDPEKKNNLVENVGAAGNHIWTNHQYTCKGPEGYNVAGISMVGTVKFLGKEGVIGGEDAADPFDDNKWLFLLNGVNFWDERTGDKNTIENHILDNLVTPASPINASSGEIVLDLSFQDLDRYSIMVYLQLAINDDFLLNWQTNVYNKIRSLEQKSVDRINQNVETTYNSQLSTYYNKLNELNAQTVNDIIQGRSEAANKQIIKEELKKHCLTMIAKEFDTISTDDLLSGQEAMETRTVSIEYDKFFAGEVEQVEMESSLNEQPKTIVGFTTVTQDVNYPKINIEVAKFKARYIQFLEQAFEWENIAYIFYPYFWAKENKWIKLMNRLDYTDNNMTAFLKAGSVRVLIAVTPSYNDAVMHFLETREPWEGGQLPVIGDPLFIPIYEEIKNQQDDMANAVAEGKPWEYELPTSLVYLQDSASPIPTELVPPTA